MADNIFVGAGAGIIGLLVGYLASGPDTEELVDQVTKQVSSSSEAATAAGAEQMKAMEGKIAGLEMALAAVSEGQASSNTAMGTKLDEAVASLSTRLDTLSADVTKSVADSGSAQTAQIQSALSQGLGKLEGSIGELAAAATAAVASPAVAAVASGDTVAAPAPIEEQIDGVKIGQTEILLDGAVRVFVSGVDQEAKVARVAVNGFSTQFLGGYHDVTFMIGETPCTLLLDDIVKGHVQMSANCEE